MSSETGSITNKALAKIKKGRNKTKVEKDPENNVL
jgi:hypothetical protein